MEGERTDAICAQSASATAVLQLVSFGRMSWLQHASKQSLNTFTCGLLTLVSLRIVSSLSWEK